MLSSFSLGILSPFILKVLVKGWTVYLSQNLNKLSFRYKSTDGHE